MTDNESAIFLGTRPKDARKLLAELQEKRRELDGLIEYLERVIAGAPGPCIRD